MLYFKRLMTLQGHEEYALQLNAFDVLSPSQGESGDAAVQDVPLLVCVMAWGEGLSAMRVIDLHTEGEPTRVIVEGGPAAGRRADGRRRERFAREFDHVRPLRASPSRTATRRWSARSLRAP